MHRSCDMTRVYAPSFEPFCSGAGSDSKHGESVRYFITLRFSFFFVPSSLALHLHRQFDEIYLNVKLTMETLIESVILGSVFKIILDTFESLK